MRIGVLGTGTIASAAVRGIAGNGHAIVVSIRSPDQSAALAAEFATVTVADNQTVLDQSDVILIGLMSDVAATILPTLRFSPHQRVISFMAGTSFAETARLVAPAQMVALMLPFPGIATGGTPILMIGDPVLVQDLFGMTGPVFHLGDQAELDAYLCAQAVLSPIARMIDDTARWLAPRVDDSAKAEAFLRCLVSASLGPAPAANLIAALNTPGGYNQRLRQHMEAQGMGAALTEGLTKLESGT